MTDQEKMQKKCEKKIAKQASEIAILRARVKQLKAAVGGDIEDRIEAVVSDSLESRMRADMKNAKSGSIDNEQEYIKQLNRAYYDLQQPRIMHNNRIKRMIRDEIYHADEAARFHGDLTLELLETAELHMKKRFTVFVERQPIWHQWLEGIRGIGPVLSAGLIAELGTSKNFDNVGKLWAYCGLSVQDGVAVKRKKGEKIRWNTIAKTLCWKIADCFVKVGGPYRQLYDLRKAFEREQHPVAIPTGRGKEHQYSDGHIHARAARYAVKMFISNFWEAWRKVEGLTTVPPYGVGIEGHGFKIDPWDFPQNPDKYLVHARDAWMNKRQAG